MAKTKTKSAPKVIKRLLIMRKGDCSPDLIEKAGLTPYVVGQPLNISPAAWADEAGVSHYGWQLEGMKLTALNDLTKWTEQPENHAATLLLLDDDTDVEKALEGVGLRINELAD